MKKTFLLLVILLFSVSFVYAGELVDVSGRVVDADGNAEVISGTTLFVNGERVDEIVDIDNEEGSFVFKNLDLSKPNTLYVESNCFYHAFDVKEKEGKFAIRDAMDSNEEFLREKSSVLNLGRLEEDKSIRLNIDSDDKVTMLVERSDGESVAENSAYRKNQGNFGNIEPKTNYKVILKTESGDSFEKSFMTGDYCQGTRIIKRGNYFEVENFENNVFPKIGFMKKVKLFFKGLF